MSDGGVWGSVGARAAPLSVGDLVPTRARAKAALLWWARSRGASQPPCSGLMTGAPFERSGGPALHPSTAPLLQIHLQPPLLLIRIGLPELVPVKPARSDTQGHVLGPRCGR